MGICTCQAAEIGAVTGSAAGDKKAHAGVLLGLAAGLGHDGSGATGKKSACDCQFFHFHGFPLIGYLFLSFVLALQFEASHH
jgi:hypothetical protein